ncbi:MAG TPA: SulP family inorganic anion transporter, partial [Cellvibrionaceae bacterium]
MNNISRYLPILSWGKNYSRHMLASDLLAAAIVTVMLIPQSLAYAMLAGLPPEVGLYASLLPLVVYGIFGTSRTLSVGPVAIISLMTAAAIGSLGAVDPALKLALAAALALVSGALLVVLGLLRLGFLANFLSHPVIAGFISASAIVIAISQLKHLLGIDASGHNLWQLGQSLAANISGLHLPTLAVGVGTLGFLVWARAGLAPLLTRIGLSAPAAGVAAKTGPALVVLITTILAWQFNWQALGVALVGEVPRALPGVAWPALSRELWLSLIAPALLIAIIGFVESVSVAQTLAAKRRQRIEPDQELIALGAANIGAGITQGLPVTGGFSRSIVNFDAGAQTPAAGMFTALAIALVALSLTPLLAFLPKVTLAATIIVAVLSLVDLSVLKKTWHYSRADFIAVTSTLILTLLVGVELGIATGVMLSILIYLLKSSRPHMAIVGQLEGTEHYRNILRHQVITHPSILSVRV